MLIMKCLCSLSVNNVYKKYFNKTYRVDVSKSVKKKKPYTYFTIRD